MKEIGEPGYLNQNCWLVKTLSYPPAKRCLYCEMKFRDCPFFQCLVATLFVGIFIFAFSLLFEGEISKNTIAFLLFVILIYGYLFTRSTEKLIKASFLQRKLAKELGKTTQKLKVEVEQKTKELKNLAEKREEIIKERTKELQEKIKELEKFRKLMVGREIKMIELKKEVRRLQEELKNLKGRNFNKI